MRHSMSSSRRPKRRRDDRVVSRVIFLQPHRADMSVVLRLTLGLVLLLTCADAAVAQRATRDPQTLAKEGSTALEERRFADALTAFTAAAKLVPRDPGLAFGAGFAAYMLGQNDEAESWLAGALKLEPGLVPASMWLGELQYRKGRLDEAIATYESALKQAPKTPRLEARLAEWRKEQQLTGRFSQSRGTHFTVLFEGPSDDILARRIVDRLESAYLRVGQALSAYPTQPVTVVLSTTEQFHDITRMPAWTAAAYDGRIHVPARGALQQVDELDRVLTHEFVHSVVAMLGGPNVPVWLNEGLATALEPGGLAEADTLLAAVNVRPQLQQLHGSFSRFNAAEAQLAYAYSTHAVHRIMELRGAYAVVGLLQDLARGTDFSAAFRKHAAMRYEDFQAMVSRE